MLYVWRSGVSVAASILVAACAVAPPANFVPVGMVPASTDVVLDAYQFSISPPNHSLKNARWTVYVGKADRRNAVLRTGDASQTYSLSVQYKADLLDTTRLLRLAQAHHQQIRFFHTANNPHCVLGELAGKPMEAIAIIALCVNSKTGEAYELALWEHSGSNTGADKEMKDSMLATVSSFRFK